MKKRSRSDWNPAIGRHEQECGASRLDRIAHVATFVGRQVVEDDDITQVERGYQVLDPHHLKCKLQQLWKIIAAQSFDGTGEYLV